MKMCQPHWEKIRKAINDRGMGHLGAKTGKQAMANAITELEGRSAENGFDPLMGCNNMIWSQALKILGLGLMSNNPDGSEKCPVCEAMIAYERWWIDGPADVMLKEAKEQKLIEDGEPAQGSVET